MQEEGKTLKQYCKEAKKRLKSGFWQNYKKTLSNEITRAENDGISVSAVKEYLNRQVADGIRGVDDDAEAFYGRVKELLDREGEVSDAIGRLTDKEVYESLPYDEKQRYTLSLSERYLKAVERYRKEKSLLG